MSFSRDIFSINREGQPTFIGTAVYGNESLEEVIRHSLYILHTVYGPSHSMSILNEDGTVVKVLRS